MLKIKTIVLMLSLVPAVALVGGCGFDGGAIFGGSGTSPNINVFGAVNDAQPLSVQVKKALRNNGQTAQARINVSQSSEDTVRLAGFVSNDAVRQEAERVAYRIDGVRFVVNTLDIEN